MNDLMKNLGTIFAPFLGKAVLTIVIVATIALISSIIVYLIRRKKS